MFKYKYKVPKKEFDTTYGSICIENVIFEPNEIEKVLPEIILQDDNLKHMFAIEEITPSRRKNIYKRFIPKVKTTSDMYKYVQAAIDNNKTFYSFLAEGILGLVFRDMYNYNLARGVIDIQETLTDSHTGVDACMYNLKQNIIVLGEAKFYETLEGGLKKIISDFVEKGIKNKLESLQTGAENCEETNQIIIKNLTLDNYDELTVDQFMNQRIIFAGFVLHSEEDIIKYGEISFYDKFFISSQQLKDNICHSLNNSVDGDYEIILIHLPIKDKKSLIIKMIETSKNKLRSV
jgi:hypothetical protein